MNPDVWTILGNFREPENILLCEIQIVRGKRRQGPGFENLCILGWTHGNVVFDIPELGPSTTCGTCDIGKRKRK